jgi:hypothetical protein
VLRGVLGVFGGRGEEGRRGEKRGECVELSVRKRRSGTGGLEREMVSSAARRQGSGCCAGAESGLGGALSFRRRG